jgi:hypothetical protein
MNESSEAAAVGGGDPPTPTHASSNSEETLSPPTRPYRLREPTVPGMRFLMLGDNGRCLPSFGERSIRTGKRRPPSSLRASPIASSTWRGLPRPNVGRPGTDVPFGPPRCFVTVTGRCERNRCGRPRARSRPMSACVDGYGRPRIPLGHLLIRRLGVSSLSGRAERRLPFARNMCASIDVVIP